jgi:MFS family permease
MEHRTERHGFGNDAERRMAVEANPRQSGSTATLAVAAAGPLLVLIAFTVPLTTLTSTAVALGAGPGVQAWIMSAMSVGAAAGLLSSGAIGDDYGRRRTFLAGTLVLASSSLLGALAPTAPVLVTARVLQGLGGAAILACSLGLVGHAFPAGPERARATGVWAAALGAGVAIGPILSAGLDILGGWRMPYVLTALAAATLAVAGGALLAESRAAEPRRLDVAGTLLLGLGLTAVLAGLTEGRTGWDRLPVIELLVAGVVLVAGFVAVERRSAAPMLDLTLFRRPDFAGATTAALASGAGVLSLVSFVPTLLERAVGTGALLGAVVLLAWSATTALTSLAARWLPTWLTPRMQLIAGLVGVAAGQLALFGIIPEVSFGRLLPALLLAGLANGVLNAALGYQAVASVPADRAAMGSGANNTARYLGSAIGLTVVTVLVTHADATPGATGLVSGWNMAVLISGGFSLLGALAVFLARERPARSNPEPSERAASCDCGEAVAAPN